MQVQDPIHGYITLEGVEEDLLDTAPVQRLRRIKQLGFSHLVYPSATHTRFEHSLGALSLADQFAGSLGLEEEDARHLRAAALLHDLGHGPFSHSTEPFFEEAGKGHEDFSVQRICSSPVVDILEENGMDPERVCSLVEGEGKLGMLVAGHIDVDRMDYLMRDAYYSGVAYGTIESETIVRSATFSRGELVFDAQYVSALESLLTARYLMMIPVYVHRTVEIATTMFQEAVRRYRQDNGLPIDRLATMDDPALVTELRREGVPAELMGRIDNRQLYKAVAELPVGALDSVSGEELAEESGVETHHVLVDTIDLGEDDPHDVPVVEDGELKDLEECSDLPAALRSSLSRHRMTRVYAPGEHVEAVEKAVSGFT